MTPDAPAPVASVDGTRAWDFLVAFFASRRSFLAVFARYEARVLRFARDAGVHRDDLALAAGDLATLFHPKRLQHLRDVRFASLRATAHALFREQGAVDPLDTVASHAFHELSILLEEHLSVVRFRDLSDRRRYAQMFEEVSGYYPTRLRRIRKLFADGLRLIEEVLPAWGRDRVVIRSAYLFGERLTRGVFEEGGLAGLYARMYPSGGAAEGYLEVGRSFLASGFEREARRALARAAALERPSRGGRRARDRRAVACAAEARRLLRELPPEPVVPAAGF